MEIFGTKWDEYYIQSQRLDLYQKAAERLVKEGHAYKDEGAIRIKIPKNGEVSYHDFVLDKDISWNTDTLKDLVLLKSDGFPTYHLAVVVDDHEMDITHVLRGHDWLPSTPLHLLLYKFFGYKMPEIGHLTDIMDPEGGKLSKRKGSTSVNGLIAEGYLPEALFNFVVLLGWAPKDNRELFTLPEFVEAFDPKGFQKANPVFNRDKLDWFNGEYIRKLSIDELVKKLDLEPTAKNKSIVGLTQDRIKKLTDFDSLAGFFFARPDVNRELLGKNYKSHLTAALEAIEKGIPLDKVPKDSNFKVGDFFMDLRVAVAGSRFTPPINESIEILGKEETLERLKIVL